MNIEYALHKEHVPAVLLFYKDCHRFSYCFTLTNTSTRASIYGIHRPTAICSTNHITLLVDYGFLRLRWRSWAKICFSFTKWILWSWISITFCDIWKRLKVSLQIIWNSRFFQYFLQMCPLIQVKIPANQGFWYGKFSFLM